MPQEHFTTPRRFKDEREARKARDTRARELRKNGYQVECRKSDFGGLGFGVDYILEWEEQHSNVLAETPPPYSMPRYRVALVREAGIELNSYPRYANSTEVAALFRAFLSEYDRELMIVAGVDQKNRLIGFNIVSIGTISQSFAMPAEVLKPLILMNASACLLVHNHISGHPGPSAEDSRCTDRLASACKLLGIRLLDHVIIGSGTEEYYSFTDAGMLNPQ